jgi:hypothetical protein
LMYSLLLEAMGKRVTNQWLHIPPCGRSMNPPKNQHLVTKSFWVVQSHAICWEAWKCKTQVCVCMSFAWTFPLEYTLDCNLVNTYLLNDIGDRWCLMLVTYHDKYPPHTNILFAWCIFIGQHFVLLIGAMENVSEIYWKSWTMFSYICMF